MPKNNNYGLKAGGGGAGKKIFGVKGGTPKEFFQVLQ